MSSPSITFLNMSGDVTITWDEHNKDQILDLIRKKMSEGYTFFITKKVPLIPLHRKVKVGLDDLESIDHVILTDEQFSKIMEGVNDKDVASVVSSGVASLTKRSESPEESDGPRKSIDPREVLEANSVALRPIRGG